MSFSPQPVMQELAAEKVGMRKTQKELRKQHKQLAKDKEEKEKLLAELSAKAHDVQVRDVLFLLRNMMPCMLVMWHLACLWDVRTTC